MASKKKLFIGFLAIVMATLIFVVILNGGITGNSIYKTYSIEDFPGIYIDFGPSPTEGSSKWGPAAVGNYGELWNAPYIEANQYVYSPLKYANGDLSSMKIQISNFDSIGEIKTNLGDVMFESYIYSGDLNKIPSIIVSDLTEGSYDIYLYGNLENSSANYELYGYNYMGAEIKPTFYGIKSSFINSNVLFENEWNEGTHYVIYKDIYFAKGDSLEIMVKSFDDQGNRAYPFISGMQLVRTGTKLAYNASVKSETYDCYDSDGGLNYSVLGKLYLNGRYSGEDMCDNENNYVNELYCQNGIKSIELHKCEFGCIEGFCITSIKFSSCEGCLFNQICISKGTRKENKYCDIDKILKLQKPDGAECKNNFECGTNSCINGKCESLNNIAKRESVLRYTLIKFICRINYFNYEKYNLCLSDSYEKMTNEDKNDVTYGNEQNENNTRNENVTYNPLPKTSL